MIFCLYVKNFYKYKYNCDIIQEVLEAVILKFKRRDGTKSVKKIFLWEMENDFLTGLLSTFTW
jgi:hypothetical protein